MRAFSLLLLACVSGCCLCGGGPRTEPPAPSAPRATGDASATPEAPAGFTHEVATHTAYYLTGPQQGRPPEGFLSVGTKAAILQDGGSYARVRTAAGIEAWVARDALKEIGGR